MLVGMSNSTDFLDFIAASPSSFHAAEAGAQILESAGFSRQFETDQWSATRGGHYLIRGGALMAWFVPESATPDSGFRIIGSHTDSPGLVLKPQPDFSSAGWQQVAVEIYGGALLHTWFDRELTVAGQVVSKDGRRLLVNTGPLLRVPSLAIHLYRKDEFKPDRQQHMQPVLSTGQPEASVLGVIGEQLGLEPGEIAAFNLITADAARGTVFGAGERFIAAGRMDNLSSVFASLQAMRRAAQIYERKDILVMAAFDHEEVGSNSRFGAAGPILDDVLSRTAGALGAEEEDRKRMYARSSCVSADAAHSVHPNYVDKHDPGHHPIIGGGPVTKINGNQRYASNAVTIAAWEAACERAGIAYQRFVGNNDVPCGSTIGPITATRLGIDTVDVGVPMLSMHSVRELVGERDQLGLALALEAYLVG